jgi:hypothetical protein
LLKSLFHRTSLPSRQGTIAPQTEKVDADGYRPNSERFLYDVQAEAPPCDIRRLRIYKGCPLIVLLFTQKRTVMARKDQVSKPDGASERQSCQAIVRFLCDVRRECGAGHARLLRCPQMGGKKKSPLLSRPLCRNKCQECFEKDATYQGAKDSRRVCTQA